MCDTFREHIYQLLLSKIVFRDTKLTSLYIQMKNFRKLTFCSQTTSLIKITHRIQFNM